MHATSSSFGAVGIEEWWCMMRVSSLREVTMSWKGRWGEVVDKGTV